MKSLALFSFLCLFLIPAVFGQEKTQKTPGDEALDRCAEESMNYPSDYFRGCVASEYEIVDETLNGVYRGVLESIDSKCLSGEDTVFMSCKAWKKALRDAQHLWIQFRDKDCEEVVVHEEGGGNDAYAYISACKLTLTVQRTDELRRRYMSQDF